MNKNYLAKLFLAQVKKFLITFVIIGTILNRANTAQVPDIVLEEKEFIVFEVGITQVNLPNDNISFTLLDIENGIICQADIKPDLLDVHNSNISWKVEDNPNITGDSGNITDLQNGDNITFAIIAEAAPSGREFPLSYKITAKIVIDSAEHISTPFYITQDNIDQCREEYIDMYKDHIPSRNEFSNSGGSTHFSWTALNHSWNYYTNSRYLWIVLRNILFTGLENTRTNLGDLPMHINSGYRSPIRNERIGGASNSRHIYGDAADVRVDDFNDDDTIDFDDWDMLSDAAQEAEADYIESFQETGTWVHMDWRNH